MTLVCIESPYAGDVGANVAYARRAMKDALDHGEAPFASHLLYTQVLDDDIPSERDYGMAAGFAFGDRCDLTAVYMDRGISRGMALGMQRAMWARRDIELPWIEGERRVQQCDVLRWLAMSRDFLAKGWL